MPARSFFLSIALGAAVPTFSQELPQPSPAATLTQRIGLVDVRVTYSRPSMKGRRIFGDLVPYGEMWRTGANHSTVIDFSGPVTISDKVLPAGKYSLFTVPDQGAWAVVINRDTTLSGLEGYSAEEDVFRFKAVSRPVAPTESFVILFENLGQDQADLVLRWAKEEVALTIDADATIMGMKNIENALKDPAADHVVYARSAGFYLDRGIDPAKALEWAQKSVDMKKEYWNTFYLARALAAAGQYSAAVAKGNGAVTLATAEKDANAAKTYQVKIAEWEALSKVK